MDAQRGYRIDFPDEAICQQIVSSMQLAASAAPWRVAQRALWMQDNVFYAHSDYWLAHCEPTEWIVHQVDAKEAQTDHLPSGARVSFAQAVAMRPETWVYDVIAQKRLRMMYQPIVDADCQGALVGYELLARGFASDGAVIPPTRLFAAAKDQNQLFRLDRACRLAAIEAAAILPHAHLVFVNFIPTSIYVPEHCLATTLAAVERTGVQAEQIVFEVVETERVDDLAHLKRILRFYRERGFRYALDDVGQGFNNLDTLQALEPDVVKLDREWVSGIHLEREKREVAKRVVDICRRMGARPLAEGVELREEADVLQELGYTWQQGYYYGRPDFTPSAASSR